MKEEDLWLVFAPQRFRSRIHATTRKKIVKKSLKFVGTREIGTRLLCWTVEIKYWPINLETWTNLRKTTIGTLETKFPRKKFPLTNAAYLKVRYMKTLYINRIKRSKRCAKSVCKQIGQQCICNSVKGEKNMIDAMRDANKEAGRWRRIVR